MLGLLGIDIGNLVIENIDTIFDYIAKEKGWNKEEFNIILQSRNKEILIIIIRNGQAVGKLTKEQLTKILK